MCQVEILGKLMEKLIFLIQLRKTIWRVELNQDKKTKNKIASTLQEDCQAFGLITDKSLSLKEVFSFRITTVPLSIALSDGALR